MEQPQPVDVIQEMVAQLDNDDDGGFYFENARHEGREDELEDVIRMLRRDSSSAYLCGRDEEARYIDSLVERLEREEHREQMRRKT